jgi:hypothetical protein
MKTPRSHPVKLLIIAIACSFAAGSTSEAGALNPISSMPPPNGADLTHNARLIVWRAADFGTVIYLNLFIDGVQVTMMGRNVGYQAILRPGEHLLSISTTPCPYGKTRYTHRRVTMRRGQTYAFTALWEESDRATLQTWDDTNRVGRTGW